MLDRIFGNTKVASRALDASWLRNDTISQNIANVDTPGYKRKNVSFEEHLNEALDDSSFKGRMTDRRHIPIGGTDVDNIDIKVNTDNSTSLRLDGNNVDIENEMSSMAKNTIFYNTLIERLNGQFKALRSAINEGRK